MSTPAAPEIPACPGCGSPPAASDVDDVCPECGAYLYRCGRVTHIRLTPRQQDFAPIVQQRTWPYWERIPPSKVGKKPAAPLKDEPTAPDGKQSRARTPTETTEQPIIDALYKMGAIGLDGLKAIPKNERPTGERLAPKAIGRDCDGQFKTTLKHMIDLGWLDNGRNHGIGSGYFLTDAGLALVSAKVRT